MIPCMSINGDSAAEAVAVLARSMYGAAEVGHLLRLPPDQFAAGLRTTPREGKFYEPVNRPRLHRQPWGHVEQPSRTQMLYKFRDGRVSPPPCGPGI